MLLFIYSSSKRRQDFKNFCKSQNKIFEKPKFDMPVRWNLTYKMLKKSFCQKDLLVEFYQINTYNNIIQQDWNIIEMLLEILQVFFLGNNYFT